MATRSKRGKNPPPFGHPLKRGTWQVDAVVFSDVEERGDGDT